MNDFVHVRDIYANFSQRIGNRINLLNKDEQGELVYPDHGMLGRRYTLGKKNLDRKYTVIKEVLELAKNSMRSILVSFSDLDYLEVSSHLRVHYLKDIVIAKAKSAGTTSGADD